MDEFQHHERLTADNDYQEGQWINGEFFYKKRKAARQQTEEDRLYGVWQGSSDEEDEEGFRKKRKKKGHDSAVLHKEVAFVSSGTVVGTTDDKFVVNDKVRALSSGDAQLAGQHAGLGASAAADTETKDEEDDAPVVPTGTARMLHMAAQEKRNKAAKEREGTMQRKKVLKADPELAKFENHSKGIGSKLLKMMGWKPGEGLGKGKEGIAKPLEASMRPKGAGLGAAGEEPSMAPKAAQPTAEKKKEAAQPQSALKLAWKARNRTKAASANVVKSADELVAEQEVAGGVLGAGAAPAMTILDFTGPQTRVVSNMEDLKGSDRDHDLSEVPFPELQHNLKLLVDIAEGDIRRLDGRVRLEHEKAEMLQQQAHELESEATRLDTELARATNVLSMVSIVDDRMKEQLVESDELLAIYEQVKESFPEEFIMFDCPAIAVYQLLPSMVPDLAAWDVLQAPLQWLPSFTAWKRLLKTQTAPTADDLASEPSPTDPFSELLLQAVYPPLRSAVMSSWDPLQPGPLLQFFDHWNTVLPPPVSRNLLHTMVLPRVRECVHRWVAAPATAPPAHLWLHPWLPLMAAELQDLYPLVRKVMVQILSAWSPPDPSAHALLFPWKQIWKASEWKDITNRAVVPALEAAMHHVLNLFPHPVEQFNVTPCIFERVFFPKLHQVLHFWLVNSTQVSFSEVTDWLSSKQQTCIPPLLANDPSILHQMAAAAAAVAEFEEHHVLPRGYPIVPPFSDMMASRRAADDAAVEEHLQEVHMFSIKDFLEHKAEQAGLTYMPRQGRQVSGLQVYALGQLSVIVDVHAGVTKAFLVDRWVPMGVEELVQLALSRS